MSMEQKPLSGIAGNRLLPGSNIIDAAQRWYQTWSSPSSGVYFPKPETKEPKQKLRLWVL